MAIYSCYSWKKELNAGLDASFDNKQGCKGTRRKAGNGNSRKACTTGDETGH
jgi:hypothetical protein